MNVDNLYIEGTDSTPLVELNVDEKVLNINGISIPENPHYFYSRIYDRIDGLTIDDITININLTYVNSTSYKTLLILFMKLRDKRMEVIINWTYEEDDEDILDVINDVESISNLKINKIKTQGDLFE